MHVVFFSNYRESFYFHFLESLQLGLQVRNKIQEKNGTRADREYVILTSIRPLANNWLLKYTLLHKSCFVLFLSRYNRPCNNKT